MNARFRTLRRYFHRLPDEHVKEVKLILKGMIFFFFIHNFLQQAIYPTKQY